MRAPCRTILVAAHWYDARSRCAGSAALWPRYPRDTEERAESASWRARQAFRRGSAQPRDPSESQSSSPLRRRHSLSLLAVTILRIEDINSCVSRIITHRSEIRIRSARLFNEHHRKCRHVCEYKLVLGAVCSSASKAWRVIFFYVSLPRSTLGFPRSSTCGLPASRHPARVSHNVSPSKVQFCVILCRVVFCF